GTGPRGDEHAGKRASRVARAADGVSREPDAVNLSGARTAGVACRKACAARTWETHGRSRNTEEAAARRALARADLKVRRFRRLRHAAAIRRLDRRAQLAAQPCRPVRCLAHGAELLCVAEGAWA